MTTTRRPEDLMEAQQVFHHTEALKKQNKTTNDEKMLNVESGLSE